MRWDSCDGYFQNPNGPTRVLFPISGGQKKGNKEADRSSLKPFSGP